jgi:two-component system, OmpR family, sensor kinase
VRPEELSAVTPGDTPAPPGTPGDTPAPPGTPGDTPAPPGTPGDTPAPQGTPRDTPAPPRQKTRSLRERLLLALVGVSVGSVFLAGLITVVSARRVDRTQALSELRTSLASLAAAEKAGEPFPRLVRLQRILRLSGIGLVVVNDRGAITTVGTGPLGRRLPGRPFDSRNLDLDAIREAAGSGSQGSLPPGVRLADLDAAALYRGEVDTGHRGALVFVAQPLTPKNAGVPVLVATRHLSPFGRLGTVLISAAVAAALAAAAVSLWLVRRLTRPLAAMERAAQAIASGDLQARVEGMAGADDELAALGHAIDSMAAELERARGLERAFLMSVSHDLRTPLTSIRGYAEAVAEGAVDDEESRTRAASIIGAEARRLERLVADLLDLARLNAREFSLRPRLIDVAEVVGGATEALRPAAAEAGLRLVGPDYGDTPGPGGPDSPAPAEVDPERLAQVVANLVENALKYATTAVEVTVSREGNLVRISVTDDGPGIDAADLPRVFERLYASRRQPGRQVGTGLGLAIVRELVEAMGGTVEATRTPEGGTRLVVTLSGSSSSSSGGLSRSSTTSASRPSGSWSSSTTPLPSTTSAPSRRSTGAEGSST